MELSKFVLSFVQSMRTMELNGGKAARAIVNADVREQCESIFIVCIMNWPAMLML